MKYRLLISDIIWNVLSFPMMYRVFRFLIIAVKSIEIIFLSRLLDNVAQLLDNVKKLYKQYRKIF